MMGMARLLCVFGIVWSAAVFDHSANATPPSTVTTVLALPVVKTLTGCWRARDGSETWTFRSKGPAALEVVARFVGDEAYERRARIPSDLMYDPATDTFAFAHGGRIHALLVMFTIRGSELDAAFYSKRNPTTGYVSTGSRAVLQRC
jgi:hypothetical protein